MTRAIFFRGRARLAVAFALLLASLAACAPQAGSDPGAWELVDVVDGDTLRVRRGGESGLVRLVGIDAPEKRHPQRLPEFLAEEARERLEEVLRGARFDLVLNERGDVEDRYGRMLRYAQVPGEGDPAEVLLREGLVRVYERFPHDRLARYRELEREARDAQRGLWSEGGLAEVKWRLAGRSPGIEVVPVGGADFAVVYERWAVTGLGGERLLDALWAARRAAALRERGEDREAERELRESGFRPLR
jgi:endonuclease YncB( thermonuclease family)